MLWGYCPRWVQPSNRSSLYDRQDEEVAEQEEQDGNSDNEAEEEEEFYDGKTLWEAEENPESQVHAESVAVKVKPRVNVVASKRLIFSKMN